ncbi:MAG: hypothetical protein M3506_00580 [Chloroflexota bacterium]|nr:hypothetical protein [Chloroflexota bacterium]
MTETIRREKADDRRADLSLVVPTLAPDDLDAWDQHLLISERYREYRSTQID